MLQVPHVVPATNKTLPPSKRAQTAQSQFAITPAIKKQRADAFRLAYQKERKKPLPEFENKYGVYGLIDRRGDALQRRLGTETRLRGRTLPDYCATLKLYLGRVAKSRDALKRIKADVDDKRLIATPTVAWSINQERFDTSYPVQVEIWFAKRIKAAVSEKKWALAHHLCEVKRVKLEQLKALSDDWIAIATEIGLFEAEAFDRAIRAACFKVMFAAAYKKIRSGRDAVAAATIIAMLSDSDKRMSFGFSPYAVGNLARKLAKFNAKGAR